MPARRIAAPVTGPGPVDDGVPPGAAPIEVAQSLGRSAAPRPNGGVRRAREAAPRRPVRTGGARSSGTAKGPNDPKRARTSDHSRLAAISCALPRWGAVAARPSGRPVGSPSAPPPPGTTQARRWTWSPHWPTTCTPPDASNAHNRRTGPGRRRPGHPCGGVPACESLKA